MKPILGQSSIVVRNYPDGRLAIRYNGAELAYRTFDKIGTSTRVPSPRISGWGQCWR